MRALFKRGQMWCAILSTVIVTSCNHASTSMPTTPTVANPPVVVVTSVSAVIPAEPLQSDLPQLVRVQGLNFRAGLSLSVRDPSGRSVTIPNLAIQNQLSTSFQASVVLDSIGAYGFVVVQSDGDSSVSFLVNVRGIPPLAPIIDSVSPASTVRSAVAQLVSLAGHDFDPSLTVQIVDPQSLLTQLNRSNLSASTDSLIEFSMILDKAGNYTISLWTALGPASNLKIISVR
jgi:hypothetical protein